jgi:hypothetical protein
VKVSPSDVFTRRRSIEDLLPLLEEKAKNWASNPKSRRYHLEAGDYYGEASLALWEWFRLTYPTSTDKDRVIDPDEVAPLLTKAAARLRRRFRPVSRTKKAEVLPEDTWVDYLEDDRLSQAVREVFPDEWALLAAYYLGLGVPKAPSFHAAARLAFSVGKCARVRPRKEARLWETWKAKRKKLSAILAEFGFCSAEVAESLPPDFGAKYPYTPGPLRRDHARKYPVKRRPHPFDFGVVNGVDYSVAVADYFSGRGRLPRSLRVPRRKNPGE